MTSIAFFLVAVPVLAVLLLAPFTRARLWRATLTPLASIIGSGFLVSAPLLSREFGGYAAPAMLILIVLAALIGWTIRYNIAVVEEELEKGKDLALVSIEKLSHVVLAFAYFISITYYLFLLGNFVVTALGIEAGNLPMFIAIGLLVAVGLLGWSGGAARIAQVERYTAALNIAVIAGFLAALAVYGTELIWAGKSVAPMEGKFSLSSLPVLLGLLIVVQGFETTRFTGDDFDRKTRIAAMKLAQLVSGIVYVAFFVLLSPLLEQLSQGKGVAAIISLSASVAVVLPLSLTLAAVASQFSASIADSLGDAGLIEEVTERKVTPSHAYPLIAAVGIGILLTMDVNHVIALASRAFALFYALQCFVAFESARKKRGQQAKAAAFSVLGLVSFCVFLFGVPAG